MSTMRSPRTLGILISLSFFLTCFLGLGGFTLSAPGDEAALRRQILDLNNLTGRAAQAKAVKAFLADKAATKRLLEVADRMAAAKEQPLNRNAIYLLAVTADALKHTEISARFYRRSVALETQLKSEGGIVQAYNGLIGMYFDNGRYTDAEKVCQEVLGLKIEADPNNEEPTELELFRSTVQRRQILALAKQGQHNRALELCDDFIREMPQNWLFRIAKAQVYRDAERYNEAIKGYLEVLDIIKTDRRIPAEEREDFIGEYRYALSGLYVDNNQIDKAAEQLQILLKKEPTNPTFNNDLGFIWADKGLKLEESEQLIRKAVEEDKKLQRKANPKLKPGEEKANAAYLDSLGWVLFKRGKAKEALTHLQEAVKDTDGQVTEIYDHLGDVYLALGQKAEALTAWKQGLAVVSVTSKRDQKRKTEIEAKIKRHGEAK